MTSTRIASAIGALLVAGSAFAQAVVINGGDRRFMIDAAHGGATEIEASKVAEQKATNADVKAYATMMIGDHTKAGDELKALATAKNVPLPDAPTKGQQKDVAKLGTRSGSDFDRAYVKQMLADHRKTVKMFDERSKGAKDPDVKAFAAKTLPTLQGHLDKVKQLDETVAKAK